MVKFRVRLDKPPKIVWTLTKSENLTECYFVTDSGHLGYYQKVGNRVVDGYWMFKN